jgi:predicted CXXCH cytochrome family protein
VYRDQEPFNPPPDSASGFLGYYLSADKQTTCGNCHADKQVSWVATAHADAWAGLQSSEGAEAFCEGCHTVSELGNGVVGPAGHNAVPDEAYHDVQCESCHGPGSDHIAAPQGVQPLASISVAEDATNGCGECHSGEHHPFVEQWAESAHGNVSGYAQGRDGCNECHEGNKALQVQFGVTSSYVEAETGEPMDITCAVCHDPHGGPNPGQLRAPVSAESKNNLCVKCHNRITVPAEGTRGPHAAQGPLVFGENIGWWPPGFEWLEGLTGTHGNADANPGLCATCHVETFVVTEPEFFQSVGHTFEAIPCVDANGVPVPGPCTNDERNFSACTACHATEANSQAIYESFMAELDVYLDEVWVDSNDDGWLDGSDAGLLAEIVDQFGPRELDVSDTLFTFAEGLLWNTQLAATEDAERFFEFNLLVTPQDTVEISGHAASGNGVHNPPFLDALLKASLSAGYDYYGLPQPVGVDLTITAAPITGVRNQ